ncbi:MAG: hypothetical protein ACE5KK_03385 [Candidatus Brocadiales bacterium]
MRSLRLLSILLPLVLAGCSGLGGIGGRPQTYSKTFQATFDEVWGATIKVFEDRQVELREADKGQGKIITQWLFRESEKGMGMLQRGYWKERHRLTLRIKGKERGTEVSTYAIVEEKRPGGTQAYRWTRMESTGDLEREVLEAIEAAIASVTEKGVR